jgi:hypothetical protein
MPSTSQKVLEDLCVKADIFYLGQNRTSLLGLNSQCGAARSERRTHAEGAGYHDFRPKAGARAAPRAAARRPRRPRNPKKVAHRGRGLADQGPEAAEGSSTIDANVSASLSKSTDATTNASRRGPRCTLPVYVDDATEKLIELRFVATESPWTTSTPQCRFYEALAVRWRATATNAASSERVSQFGRALPELNIAIICGASSE